jgi:hypothetical protein
MRCIGWRLWVAALSKESCFGIIHCSTQFDTFFLNIFVASSNETLASKLNTRAM